MTRADVWKKRPCVMRYRAWADEVRLAATGQPLQKLRIDVLGIYAVAYFPIPPSFTKKRARLLGDYHRSRGDTDNVLKGLMDSLLAEDRGVAVVRCVKRWCRDGEEPRTEVRLLLG